APNPGTDAAIAQAMTHVILKEFYHERQEPMFLNYAKQYTDMPFLILLDEFEGGYKAGRFLRASDLGDATQHAEWKPVIFDANTNEVTVPNGTMGQRWEQDKKWNLILEREDGSVIAPALSVEPQGGERQTISFPFFDNNANGTFERQISAKTIQLADGTQRLVVTVYDLMLSQYGIG
ncbi:molybdopterin-dependent oxidoreductase, partial [Clostridium perfringens]